MASMRPTVQISVELLAPLRNKNVNICEGQGAYVAIVLDSVSLTAFIHPTQSEISVFENFSMSHLH